jgi:hypothetical protein
MPEDTMIAKLTKNKIIIEIPLELLVFAEENNPDTPFKITNKTDMGKWISENIMEYTNSVGQEETGATVFTDLLDGLFGKAYEDGEVWLEPIDWE